MRQIQVALQLAELTKPDRRAGPCLACRTFDPWYPDSLEKVDAVRAAVELGPLIAPFLHFTHALQNQIVNLLSAQGPLSGPEWQGIPVCAGKAGTREQLEALLQAEIKRK